MIKVSYEYMLNHKNYDCILKGKILDVFKYNDSTIASYILMGQPISFNRIDRYIKQYFDEIAYIEIWSNVDIYIIKY